MLVLHEKANPCCNSTTAEMSLFSSTAKRLRDGKDLQEGQQEQRFSPNAQIDLVPNDPNGDGKEVTGAGALRNSKHTHAHTLML